jgi:hypothetical protein
VFDLKASAKPFLDLLTGEDHENIRRELAIYFGPNADVFLHTYEKMRAKALRGSGRYYVQTWNWPVFVTSFVWFFYRRLYLFGAVVFLMPIVLSLLFGDIGLAGMWGAFAILSKSMYVQIALHRVLKANRLGLTGAEREDYLRRAGGTSWLAGILAGALYALILAFFVFATFYAHKNQH